MHTGVHLVLQNFTFIGCFNPEPELQDPKSLIQFITEDFADLILEDLSII